MPYVDTMGRQTATAAMVRLHCSEDWATAHGTWETELERSYPAEHCDDTLSLRAYPLRGRAALGLPWTAPRRPARRAGDLPASVPETPRRVQGLRPRGRPQGRRPEFRTSRLNG